MTKITRKTVRETAIEYRGRKLAIELTPRAVRIWPQGTRDDVYVPWDAIYELGLKVLARKKL